jgi:hypothetical protein
MVVLVKGDVCGLPGNYITIFELYLISKPLTHNTNVSENYCIYLEFEILHKELFRHGPNKFHLKLK